MRILKCCVILGFLIFCLNKLFADYYVYGKIYSSNLNYYAEILEFSDFSAESIGQTKVYKVGDTAPLYTMEYAYQARYIYLSCDGKSIVSVNKHKDTIYCFHNGNLKKKYSICEILECDETGTELKYENGELLAYTDTARFKMLPKSYKKIAGILDTSNPDEYVFLYDKNADQDLVFADKFSEFSANDTIYFITSNLNVLKIDINTGNYIIQPYSLVKNELKKIAKLRKVVYEQRGFTSKYSSNYIDSLMNGGYIDDIFLKKYDYTFPNSSTNRICFNQDSLANLEKSNEDPAKTYLDSIEIYYIDINGLLDRNGKFKYIHLYNESPIPENEVIEIIEGYDFFVPDFPLIFDKYPYKISICFHKKDIEVARMDRWIKDSLEIIRLESLKSADSINGKYIPIDLNDAMFTLDKILPNSIKNEFDEMVDLEQLSVYHHGLGTWIRNYWSLWNNSRLAEYFKKNGCTHPDNMSGVILYSYYRFRHKLPLDFKEK